MRGPDGGWLIKPGPYGEASCLAEIRADGVVDCLVPPGVPLRPLERGSDLIHWRFAQWKNDALLTPPVTVPLQQVLGLARSQREWVLEIARAWEARSLAVGYAALERVAVALQLAEGDDESDACVARAVVSSAWILPKTHSASAFAASVANCEKDAAIRSVRAAVDGSPTVEVLCGDLATTREALGKRAVNDALVALLHGRSRSHSWRYTRWIHSPEPTEELHQLIAGAAERAYDAERLAEMIDLIRWEWPRTDNALAEIVFYRAHSARWTMTEDLRLTLANPYLRPVRAALRHQQPRINRIKQTAGPHLRRIKHAVFDHISHRDLGAHGPSEWEDALL